MICLLTLFSEDVLHGGVNLPHGVRNVLLPRVQCVLVHPRVSELISHRAVAMDPCLSFVVVSALLCGSTFAA